MDGCISGLQPRAPPPRAARRSALSRPCRRRRGRNAMTAAVTMEVRAPRGAMGMPAS
jgi:hypothetical protein